MVSPVGLGFNLAAAEAFVKAQGSPMQRAWWGAAFGHGPVEVLLFELMPFQQENGAWGGAVGPGCPAESPASKAATLFVLRLISGLNLSEDVFEIGPRTLEALAQARVDQGRFAWPDGHLEGAELLSFAAHLDRMGAEGEAYEAAMQQAAACVKAHEGEAWWALGWGPLALGRHPEFAALAERIEAGLADTTLGSITGSTAENQTHLAHPAWAPEAHFGLAGTLASWQSALAQRGRPSNHPLRLHLAQGLTALQGDGQGFEAPAGVDAVWATALGARGILAH